TPIYSADVGSHPAHTPLHSFPTRRSSDLSLEVNARTILDEARELLDGYPGKVNYLIERGDAAGVMVGLSSQAELAVVGARGRGGFVGRILCSVSSALPAHSHCLTVVVPSGYAVEGPGGPGHRAPPPEWSHVGCVG